MNHRERLEVALSGEKPDRTPVALWRHFPVDDQNPEDLASATIDFQHKYDFDFVKVTPASSFCLKDWGADDVWQGSIEGTRDYTHWVVSRPEDWLELSVLDPYKGYLSKQLDALGLITKSLGTGTPVIQTIFSPLAQAKNLASQERLLLHLRTSPQALHAGLERITESTQQFIEAAIRTGIAGIFYAVQHAQFGLLSSDEYGEFGRAYDLRVLEVATDLWLNVLHLHGMDTMFTEVANYPVAVINWHDQETPPSLNEAKEMFSGLVCGGLRRWEALVVGTPEKVTAEAREAIEATNGHRFILGTGCVVPIVAPGANLMAARRSVET
ncbi:MAG: uroporphyrinogen decarboxylase family protein [Chloroflexota bacterium]